MFIKLILAVDIFQKKLNSHKKRHCILLFFKFKQNTLLYKFRYFPKGFFPSDNFPRVFPKWQLPKCAISQAATSQFCPNCIARPSACSNLCEVATGLATGFAVCNMCGEERFASHTTGHATALWIWTSGGLDIRSICC